MGGEETGEKPIDLIGKESEEISGSDVGVVNKNPQKDKRIFVVAVAIFVTVSVISLIGNLYLPRNEILIESILRVAIRTTLFALLYLSLLKFVITSESIIKHIVTVSISTFLLFLPLVTISYFGRILSFRDTEEFLSKCSVEGFGAWLYLLLFITVIIAQVFLVLLQYKKHRLAVFVIYALFMFSVFRFTGFHSVAL